MSDTAPSFDRRSLIAGALAGLCASPALAEALTPENEARLKEVNAYLTSLREVKARFNQADPRGALSSGTVWLKRPGMARFEYDAPSDLLVVCDGKRISVWDKRIKSFDSYPLGYTPLGLLLAKEVRLSKGVEITDVSETGRGFHLTARDAAHRAAGAITLLFNDNPLTLAGWVVTDSRRARTQVALGQLEPVSGLGPDLFVLKDPRRRTDEP
jgi:outer membrane lipoprotein-sorting protein